MVGAVLCLIRIPVLAHLGAQQVDIPAETIAQRGAFPDADRARSGLPDQGRFQRRAGVAEDLIQLVPAGRPVRGLRRRALRRLLLLRLFARDGSRVGFRGFDLGLGLRLGGGRGTVVLLSLASGLTSPARDGSGMLFTTLTATAPPPGFGLPQLFGLVDLNPEKISSTTTPLWNITEAIQCFPSDSALIECLEVLRHLCPVPGERWGGPPGPRGSSRITLHQVVYRARRATLACGPGRSDRRRSAH